MEDGGAVAAHGSVAVEGEQHVALSAELTHEALGLAPLGVGVEARLSALLPRARGPSPPWGLGEETPGPPWGTHLTVQLDVLGEERVGLGERAAQAARVCVQQVLDRVHLVVLHEVLPVLELWVQQP